MRKTVLTIFMCLLITVLTPFLHGCGDDNVTAITYPTLTPTPEGLFVVPDDNRPELVAIEGGTFKMGSNYYMSEQPVHDVTVNSFYMGKYEVTNKQYCEFLNSQASVDPSWIKIDTKPDNPFSPSNGLYGSYQIPSAIAVKPGYDNRPVVYVSWYGAVAYCNWLSEKEELEKCYGADPDNEDPAVWRTKNGYRLPTEAEWEYACRGGEETDYYWGENHPPSHINNYCWYVSNSGSNHHNKGEKLPNNYELYDMSGNILEWCSDWYDPFFYQSSPSNDPAGPSAKAVDRVIRGGSFYTSDDVCMSSRRSLSRPSFQPFDTGFRLVKNQ